jgi:hypothetical protein
MIIALSGHKESGKTTCANWLVEMGGWEKLSFAEPLRCELVEAGIPPRWLYDKPTKPEARRLMQAWGDAWRAVDSRHYIDMLLDNMFSCIDNNVNVVIDDLRYLNEAEALQQEGATLVRLKKVVHHKPHMDVVQACSCQSSAEAHQSEHDLDGYIGFDYYIEAREGDLGALKAMLMGMVSRETRMPGGVV